MTNPTVPPSARGNKKTIIIVDEIVNGFLENNFIADKAIMAMVVLMVGRQPKDVGVGPNRDDAKIFTGIAEAYVAHKSVPKDVLFRARFRVRKYARQLRESKFYGQLMDDGVGVDVFIQHYVNAKNNKMGYATLAAEIETVRGYGDW